MQRDWKGPYQRRLAIKASERGKRLANIRWQRDRERREKLAELTAEQNPTKIEGRIVAIRGEQTVKEFVLWSFDSWREKRRKCRKAEAFLLG